MPNNGVTNSVFIMLKTRIRVFTKSIELVNTENNDSVLISSEKFDLTKKWILSDGSRTTITDTQINYFYDLTCN